MLNWTLDIFTESCVCPQNIAGKRSVLPFAVIKGGPSDKHMRNILPQGNVMAEEKKNNCDKTSTEN